MNQMWFINLILDTWYLRYFNMKRKIQNESEA
jgi:hypothetical protein